MSENFKHTHLDTLKRACDTLTGGTQVQVMSVFFFRPVYFCVTIYAFFFFFTNATLKKSSSTFVYIDAALLPPCGGNRNKHTWGLLQYFTADFSHCHIFLLHCAVYNSDFYKFKVDLWPLSVSRYETAEEPRVGGQHPVTQKSWGAGGSGGRCQWGGKEGGGRMQSQTRETSNYWQRHHVSGVQHTS